MSDDHLLDKVIFGVFNHSKGHNVKKCVSISVWHHRISSCYANQFLKDLAIELSGSYVNGRLSRDISHKWIAVAAFKQSIYHKGVATKYSLV